MTEIISVILGAITSFLKGIGGGVIDVFNSLVFVSTRAAGTDTILFTADDVITITEELTGFATWGLVFLGLGFAIMVFSKVLGMVRK